MVEVIAYVVIALLAILGAIPGIGWLVQRVAIAIRIRRNVARTARLVREHAMESKWSRETALPWMTLDSYLRAIGHKGGHAN